MLVERAGNGGSMWSLSSTDKAREPNQLLRAAHAGAGACAPETWVGMDVESLAVCDNSNKANKQAPSSGKGGRADESLRPRKTTST